MSDPLGRLERVELRNVWETEAQDFTPWLAREENLAILADTLGMDLELEALERNVGPFRADILCKDAADSSWVLVENQLERTDHTHLGQLLTYASGLHAVTVVWIAARFTEEHRAALDWLNEITDETFRFFGLEVELWKIGESPAAPKFNLVSKPNEWSRAVSQSARGIDDGELSDTKSLQRRYWQGLADAILRCDGPVRPTKPQPQSWYQCSVGRSEFYIAAVMQLKEKWIWVELFINGKNAKKYFDLLAMQEQEVESEIGAQLDWNRLPGRKGARITVKRPNVNPANEHDWSEQHRWLAETMAKLHRAFHPRVRALNHADWSPQYEKQS